MKPATLLRLWSLRKNVRGGRGAFIFVEQLDRFIGINYPREGPLASELTSSFYFWVVGSAALRQRWAVEPVETAPPRNAKEKVGTLKYNATRRAKGGSAAPSGDAKWNSGSCRLILAGVC